MIAAINVNRLRSFRYKSQEGARRTVSISFLVVKGEHGNTTVIAVR